MPSATVPQASGLEFPRRGQATEWRFASAIAAREFRKPSRSRIFEPFYRGDQTRAQRVQGTGLGLSLVKNTIERYKGTVQVQNSPGGGAQFTVHLPAAPEIA